MKKQADPINPRIISADMIAAEDSELFGESPPRHRTAICLSGGGIRSATFSLGIMQGLVSNEKLQQFHYLSTVSGGGYAGSFLSRWRNNKSNGSQSFADFPVNHLRSFSNYLSPSWGFSTDLVAVCFVFSVNFFLNLFSWLLILGAISALFFFLFQFFLMLPNIIQSKFEISRSFGFGSLIIISILIPVSVYVFSYYNTSKKFKVFKPEYMADKLAMTIYFLAIILCLSLILVVIPFQIEMHRNRLMLSSFNLPYSNPDGYTDLGFGITGGAAAALVGVIGYWSRNGSQIKRQAMGLYARLGTQLFNLVAAIAMVALLSSVSLGTHAVLDDQLRSDISEAGKRKREAALNVALRAKEYAKESPERVKLAEQAANVAAVGLHFPARKLTAAEKADAESLAQSLAQSAKAAKLRPDIDAQNANTAYRAAVDRNLGPTIKEWLWIDSSWNYWWYTLRLAFALLALAFVCSWILGINRFSLHALYSNRLTRAYLGSARTNRPGSAKSFDPDDDILMADVPWRRKTGAKAPVLFPVINMALNLTEDAVDNLDGQERKASAFTATPLQCGSDRTGYTDIRKYAGGLTLGRAMAISGAAASPNMGYHSALFVTMIMTLFNIRLGWWLPNPRLSTDKHGQAEPGRWSIWWKVREALSLTNAKADWVFVSDGGHFENLGLYEMVRRGCTRIVVVDATCDPDYNYNDLHNAIRKIQVDFGVRIDLPPTLPGQPGPGQQERVVVGRIRYDLNDISKTIGELVFVKAMLNGEEPPALTNYAKTSRSGGNTFPHHSTLDQFFNETQFESYRRLGEFSAQDLCAAIDKLDSVSATPSLAATPDSTGIAEVRAAYPLLDSNARLYTRATLDDNKVENQTAIEATPPPATITGLAGLANAFGSMNTTALVASSLLAAGAVGGVFTVGGEVALKAGQTIGVNFGKFAIAPVEIALSDEAKALAEGVPLLAPGDNNPGNKDEATPPEPDGEQTTGTDTSRQEGDAGLAAKIEGLAKSIDLLTAASSQAPPPDLELRKELIELTRLVSAGATANQLEISKKIKDLETKIDTQIEKQSHRKNLKGQQ